MLIENGLAALPGEEDFKRVSLRLIGGVIAAIGERLEAREAEQRMDASRLQVLPAGLDPHVHFDEPGFTHREDFLRGCAEAAKGGLCTVIDMPCTSVPPITTVGALDTKLGVIEKKALLDYALYAGVSGQSLEESLSAQMAALAPRVAGFKCYFISGMRSFTRLTHADFERLMAAAEKLGRPVLLHAEDLDYVESAERRLKAARGSDVPRWEDYADSRPESAELAAVAAALQLARGRERLLHIVHVATAAAARMIHEAGASCETCAHYLAFGREDFAEKGSALKTAPVVKSRAEGGRLWELLASGIIDFVASDHAPAPPEEKNTGDPWTAYGGIPGTGTMLPYLYSEGLRARRLGLPRFLDLIAGAAARRYALASRKGSIEIGKDADLALIDPVATTRVDGSRFLSKGHITPFDGMELAGRVQSTWLRGIKIFDARAFDAGEGISVSEDGVRRTLPGILAAPGVGRFLTPEVI